MATFTNAELVAIRKFCGYGVKTPIGLTLFGDYPNLEYRLLQMDDDEAAQLRTTYLTQLQTYEDAILTASENLDTRSAAVVVINPNEVADRTALYNNFRRRLCAFIGCEPGDCLRSGSRIVRG